MYSNNLNLFLLLFLLQLQAFAQESDTVGTRNKPVPGFYFSIPGKTIDLAGLNGDLVRSGLASLNPNIVGFSMGFTARNADQNSYASSAFSYLVTTDDATDANLDSKLEIFQLSLTGHYDVIASKQWLLYPYLSFGFNWARLTVSQIYGAPTFASSLSNLFEPEMIQKKYNTYIPIFGALGAGTERKITLPGLDFFIGISGGYTFSPKSYWTLENIKSYSDAPAFNNTGWGFELLFRFEANDVKPKKEPWNLYRLFK